jgi:Mn2+/Fe2+ NRAMP family transporter
MRPSYFGVVAVPVMGVMMLMSANSDIMGKFAVAGALKIVGWGATILMAAAAIGMGITAFA